MHQLDPVGRLAPSNLDVSRAAATRHEHLSAVRRTTGSRPRARRTRATGWRAVVIRLAPRQG